MDCINVVVHIEKSDHASDNHLLREFSQHDFFTALADSNVIGLLVHENSAKQVPIHLLPLTSQMEECNDKSE